MTEEDAVVELVPRLSDEGMHHLPVVDAQRRLSGMVTQSDLVAALYRSQSFTSDGQVDLEPASLKHGESLPRHFTTGTALWRHAGAFRCAVHVLLGLFCSACTLRARSA